jgi:hypothetical protein
MALQQNISNFNLSRSVALTIKDETIIAPSRIGPYENPFYKYRATLHLENNSGAEIRQMNFYMGVYGKDDLKKPYVTDAGEIGLSQLNLQDEIQNRVIAVGASDIQVELFIVDEAMKCDNENLGKPLSFVYSLGQQYYSVAVGNHINQKLKQIACGPTLDLLHSINLTIKEETILPPHSGQMYTNENVYRSTLHVENNSGIEISAMEFYLRAYENANLSWPNTEKAYKIGWGSWSLVGQPPDRRITTSAVYWDIKVELMIERSVLKCDNPNLEKPLYLLYSVGNQYKAVAVGKEINQKLKQIACGLTP